MPQQNKIMSLDSHVSLTVAVDTQALRMVADGSRSAVEVLRHSSAIFDMDTFMESLQRRLGADVEEVSETEAAGIASDLFELASDDLAEALEELQSADWAAIMSSDSQQLLVAIPVIIRHGAQDLPVSVEVVKAPAVASVPLSRLAAARGAERGGNASGKVWRSVLPLTPGVTHSLKAVVDPGPQCRFLVAATSHEVAVLDKVTLQLVSLSTSQEIEGDLPPDLASAPFEEAHTSLLTACAFTDLGRHLIVLATDAGLLLAEVGHDGQCWGRDVLRWWGEGARQRWSEGATAQALVSGLTGAVLLFPPGVSEHAPPPAAAPWVPVAQHRKAPVLSTWRLVRKAQRPASVRSLNIGSHPEGSELAWLLQPQRSRGLGRTLAAGASLLQADMLTPGETGAHAAVSARTTGHEEASTHNPTLAEAEQRPRFWVARSLCGMRLESQDGRYALYPTMPPGAALSLSQDGAVQTFLTEQAAGGTIVVSTLAEQPEASPPPGSVLHRRVLVCPDWAMRKAWLVKLLDGQHLTADPELLYDAVVQTGESAGLVVTIPGVCLLGQPRLHFLHATDLDVPLSAAAAACLSLVPVSCSIFDVTHDTDEQDEEMEFLLSIHDVGHIPIADLLKIPDLAARSHAAAHGQQPEEGQIANFQTAVRTSRGERLDLAALPAKAWRSGDPEVDGHLADASAAARFSPQTEDFPVSSLHTVERELLTTESLGELLRSCPCTSVDGGTELARTWATALPSAQRRSLGPIAATAFWHVGADGKFLHVPSGTVQRAPGRGGDDPLQFAVVAAAAGTSWLLQSQQGEWSTISVTPEEVRPLHTLAERVRGRVVSHVQAAAGAGAAALIATSWGLEAVRVVAPNGAVQHWRVAAGQSSGHLTADGAVLCVSGQSGLEVHGLTRDDPSLPPVHLSDRLTYGGSSQAVRFCWGLEDAPARSSPGRVASARLWGAHVCILADTPDAKAAVLIAHSSSPFGAIGLLTCARLPSQDVHIYCAAVSRPSAPQIVAIYDVSSQSLEGLEAWAGSDLEPDIPLGEKHWSATKRALERAAEAGAAGTCWLVAALHASQMPEDALVVLKDAVTTENAYVRVLSSGRSNQAPTPSTP